MNSATNVIDAVCLEHGVCKEQLLQSGIRTRGVAQARADAIRRLRDLHFSAEWIAGFLKISRTSVQAKLYPETYAAIYGRYQKKRAQRRAEARP